MKTKNIFANIFLIFTVLFILPIILFNTNVIEIYIRNAFMNKFFDYIVTMDGYTYIRMISRSAINYISELIECIPITIFLGFAVTTYLIYEALVNSDKIISKIVISLIIVFLVFIRNIFSAILGLTTDFIIANAFSTLSIQSSISPMPDLAFLNNILKYGNYLKLLPIIFDIAIITLIIVLIVKFIKNIDKNKIIKTLLTLLCIGLIIFITYILLSPYIISIIFMNLNYDNFVKTSAIVNYSSLIIYMLFSVIATITIFICIITMILMILIKAKGPKKCFALIPIYQCIYTLMETGCLLILPIIIWLFGIILFNNL